MCPSGSLPGFRELESALFKSSDADLARVRIMQLYRADAPYVGGGHSLRASCQPLGGASVVGVRTRLARAMR